MREAWLLWLGGACQFSRVVAAPEETHRERTGVESRCDPGRGGHTRLGCRCSGEHADCPICPPQGVLPYMEHWRDPDHLQFLPITCTFVSLLPKAQFSKRTQTWTQTRAFYMRSLGVESVGHVCELRKFIFLAGARNSFHVTAGNSSLSQLFRIASILGLK